MCFPQVQRRVLEVTVKDFDKFSRHCITGQLHLPLDGINLIKGCRMWKPLLPCTKVRVVHYVTVLKFIIIDCSCIQTYSTRCKQLSLQMKWCCQKSVSVDAEETTTGT